MQSKTLKSIIIQFKAYFDPYIETRLSDWHSLTGYLELKEIKNKTIVKRAGEKEKCLRFILDGAGAMLMEQGSREVCLDLCFENDFLSDFDSLFTGKTTNVYLRTFEPSFILIIKDPEQFYNTSTLGDKIRWVIGEQQHRRTLKANAVNLGKKLEDRYLKLLEDRPEISLRTPQYYLASYLRTSTQALSRIRRKIAGNKPP